MTGSSVFYLPVQEEYDYEIIHRAGKGNANADALSWNPITDKPQMNNIAQDLIEQEYSEAEKQQILYEFHNALREHQGVTRVLNRIKLTHNWTGLARRGKLHSKIILPKNKTSRKTKMPLIITTSETSELFEKCALDIV